jgi:Sec23/Sec24 trunk domain
VGENGIFFIVDLCISEKELAAIKTTLLATIDKLPKNIFVGLLSFNRNVFLYDFEDEYSKFACLSGATEGTTFLN